MKTETYSDVYSPVEHAFICDWLEIERPDCAQNIRLAEHYEEFNVLEDDIENIDQSIKLRKAEYCTIDLSIKNAVARLVLSNVQDRLPQWGYSREDGETILARHYNPRRNQKINVLPQFLFMINWADSGPGFSWPESYYATYLPGYDIFIVTLSQDSTDAYGYEDLAMGCFNSDESILDGSHRIITDAWKAQHDEYDQQCWSYLFYDGLIDAETAYAWAKEVWSEEADEEDEDDQSCG